MTTRYVGIGGNDSNDGLSWANRKLTLNGVEDSPVAAGDTVYIGPGYYNETLTCDVSGSGGSPITYIGDYDGSHTDGAGGVVRVDAILGTSMDYRTFRNLEVVIYGVFDNCDELIIEQCNFWTSGGTYGGLHFTNSFGSSTMITIRKCIFSGIAYNAGRHNIYFNYNTAYDNSGYIVENCIMVGATGVNSNRVGGVTVRNCVMLACTRGITATNLTAGQTTTVNNCILTGCDLAFNAGSSGYITEDYNTLYVNRISRTNVDTGANSVTTAPTFDARWFFEMVNGGSVVTPFDLAADSGLVELNSGTGAPSADMRGTTVQGTYREWGALEYDATLDIEAGTGGAGIYTRTMRMVKG